MTAGAVTGTGTLVGGLGGPAGFGEQVMPRNDDGYQFISDISSVFESGLNFFGTTYTSLYVNTNGSISFNSGISQYTPTTITGGLTPMIAPYWADVDTRTPANRGLESAPVYLDLDPVADVMTVTWAGVNYFAQHGDLQNWFQLQLYDRGSGNFEIVFRYQDVEWTTGDASGGSFGLGGVPAHAGFTAGDGSSYFELPASGDQSALLNLDATLGNTGVVGLWDFTVQSGSGNLNGGGGNDAIFGGPGNDNLNGGAGNDILNGGAGDDDLVGGPGNDTMNGGAGTDTLDYSAATASLYISLDANGGGNLFEGIDFDIYLNFENVITGSGNDTVLGNANANILSGGTGYDNLYGGAGADTLYGGANEDILVGDAGNDLIYGGDGGDVLSELYDPVNSGDDTFDGGNGIDIMYSAGGNDTVYGGTDNANNYGNLGDGNDTYFGSGGTDVVQGGNGNDTINGNAGDDSLYGEAGDDTINGGDGIDLLSGSTGNDTLDGGAGNDLLIGDDGNDILRGGAGIDILFGFAGDDTLNGGAGGDVDALYGGLGNDNFQVGGAGYGIDYIWDFTGGVGASDRVLVATGVGITSQGASGGNYNITFNNGSQAIIVGRTSILAEDLVLNGF